MQTVHPFPARMAPEIALRVLEKLPQDATVLDPMAGSGTVLRAASQLGLRATGYDVDPLSVLISRVWTRSTDVTQCLEAANSLIEEARDLDRHTFVLPWIDQDPETIQYINFWFEEKQKRELRKLSHLILNRYTGEVGDFLRLILSKIIITKGNGASIARDVSHSRPHRVYFNSEYDVLAGFKQAATRTSKIIQAQQNDLRGSVDIACGDGCDLNKIETGTIDCVLTSPPYINAIDYMRGHRLSLVWLGYSLQMLRQIRSSGLGNKIVDAGGNVGIFTPINKSALCLADLSTTNRTAVIRYAVGMSQFVQEIARVLRSNGTATVVIGNSNLSGVYISSAALIEHFAKQSGLQLIEATERKLVARRRYLPPPKEGKHISLSRRMESESILTFKRVVDGIAI